MKILGATVADNGDVQMIDRPECGGPVKPAIVYFGESVPKKVVQQGYSMIDDADAVLVLGSSLTGMSGLRLLQHAHRVDSAS